jgi:hypothetical protein
MYRKETPRPKLIPVVVLLIVALALGIWYFMR